ncbi:MAG: 5'-methylthioadenosine/S-adenosylhomocysteine nucleosidase [Oscillospiraceae bacterium]|jgi:adenosylhomocysteine nucleosidase|nr:5'-methylthioadenosine/S-adenosylhomocysteine nucleosidase [Oscillospiraceae bacterium]
MQQNSSPILVQGAMDAETDLLIGALAGAHATRIGGYLFTEGLVDGQPVIVSKTLMGMANTAASTALACQAYAPRAVINQGTAGGHDPALHRGDLVLGARLVNIHYVASKWTASGGGVHPESWRHVATELPGQDTRRSDCLPGDAALLAIARTTPYARGRLVEGTIGTGDVFNRELDRIAQLHARLGTACEQMEAFAAAQVCAGFQIPCLCIRILSNNELHQEAFDERTGADCQAFTLAVMRRMMEARG